MPSSILAKYSPELILGESSPIAITDNKLIIIWFNKSFKKIFPDSRLKGKNFVKLLVSIGIQSEIELHTKRISNFPLNKIKKDVQITPLFGNNKKNPDNYKLELINQEETIKSKRSSQENITLDLE